MTRLPPVTRRELVRRLRELGFEGPYAGGRHAYMTRGGRRVVIPNPHQGDLSPTFLSVFLRQLGISFEHWAAADQA